METLVIIFAAIAAIAMIVGSLASTIAWDLFRIDVDNRFCFACFVIAICAWTVFAILISHIG
jgi:hypothetical protein